MKLGRSFTATSVLKFPNVYSRTIVHSKLSLRGNTSLSRTNNLSPPISRPYSGPITSIISRTETRSLSNTSEYLTSPNPNTSFTNNLTSTSKPLKMSPPPSLAPGNTALITGGASGIGLALAIKCVGYGMNAIIVDNNGDHLGAAQTYLTGLSKEGQQIVGLKVDVGNLEEWETVREVVEGDFDGTLHLLALNAGTSQRGSFATPSSAPYFNKILTVNLFGVINGINTLLPFITSHTTPSSIIITGSKQGITNPPGNPAYNCSKAAVKTLAEHLSWDLRQREEVGVHLLVPGWVHTGLTGSGSPFVVKDGKDGGVELASLENKPKGAWTGEQVVEFLEQKMGECKFYVVCPDGDVSEELDRKRMAWGAGDILEGRQPLSRWREEYKEDFDDFIKKYL